MGHQIIKQPNGQLCVFSSVTDSIIVTDATPDELATMYATEAADQAAERTRKIVEAVLSGHARKIYAQFTMTYEEAVALQKWREAGSPECGPEAFE